MQFLAQGLVLRDGVDRLVEVLEWVVEKLVVVQEGRGVVEVVFGLPGSVVIRGPVEVVSPLREEGLRRACERRGVRV